MSSTRIKIDQLVEMVYHPAYARPSRCPAAEDAYTRVIYGNVLELTVGNSYSHLRINGLWIADTGSDRTWCQQDIRLDHTAASAYNQFAEGK